MVPTPHPRLNCLVTEAERDGKEGLTEAAAYFSAALLGCCFIYNTDAHSPLSSDSQNEEACAGREGRSNYDILYN